MGRVHLTRAQRAHVGYVAGWLLVVAGVWVAAGLAAALILAGLVTAASFLLLYDVDERRPGDQPVSVRAAQWFDPAR